MGHCYVHFAFVFTLRISRRTEKRNTVLKSACKGDINISEEI